MALVYCATSGINVIQWPNCTHVCIATHTHRWANRGLCPVISPPVHWANICTVLARFVGFLVTRPLRALLITWLIAAHNRRADVLCLPVCVWAYVFTPVVVCQTVWDHIGHVWACVCLLVAAAAAARATHAYVLLTDFPSDCNCFEDTRTRGWNAWTGTVYSKGIPLCSLC